MIRTISSIYFIWLTIRRLIQCKSEILISNILNWRYCVVRSEQMISILFHWLIDQIVNWRNVIERLFDVSFCCAFWICFRNCCRFDKNLIFESIVQIKKWRTIALIEWINSIRFFCNNFVFFINFVISLSNNWWKFVIMFFYEFDLFKYLFFVIFELNDLMHAISAFVVRFAR